MGIISFNDPEADDCFQGNQVSRVGWSNIQNVARRKLIMLNAATELRDLKAPPNNKLEALDHERKGQHAIRINNQWRICFVWKEDGAHDVEITDYH